MRKTAATPLVLAAFAILLLAPDVSAQTAARSFSGLQSLIKPGETLIVTDKKGVKTIADFVSIAGNQLEIEDGRRRFIFAEDSVRQIQKQDSDWDGTLIGGAIGLGLGSAVLGTCENEFTHTHEVTIECVAAGVLLPIGGGWLGGQIDHMLHKSLYVSGQQSVIQLAPVLGRDSFGVRAAIRLGAGAQ